MRVRGFAFVFPGLSYDVIQSIFSLSVKAQGEDYEFRKRQIVLRDQEEHEASGVGARQGL